MAEPQTHQPALHTLYTIGYEGLDRETFVEALRQYQITIVIDVRQRPISRKPGFSRKALREHLAASQIAYTHLVDLGTPDPVRAQLKRDHDYDQFFAQVETHLAQQTTVISDN